MEISKNLCSNAKRKAGLLIKKACDLDMDVMDYGEVGENQYSGSVYLWLEHYSFSLFIDLGSDEIKACWNSVATDREEIIEVAGMSLSDLEEWSWGLDKEDQEWLEAN
jgi:hypothetical protein